LPVYDWWVGHCIIFLKCWFLSFPCYCLKKKNVRETFNRPLCLESSTCDMFPHKTYTRLELWTVPKKLHTPKMISLICNKSLVSVDMVHLPVWASELLTHFISNPLHVFESAHPKGKTALCAHPKGKTALPWRKEFKTGFSLVLFFSSSVFPLFDETVSVSQL